MRAFLFVVTTFLILEGFSQNFVSPGIIAYTSGAYERTIQDMNKAFETTPDMDFDMRSKAHYYRGMARLNLLKAGSSSALIGSDPYLAIYNDLTRASELDAQWRSSTQSEMSLIYRQLIASGKSAYESGIYAATEAEVSRLFGLAIEKLSIAVRINNTFEANDLLGKTYDARGIFFDQMVDNEEARSRAIPSYQESLKYHEAALQLNPTSLETVRALKQLAYRLGNREMEMRYAAMEERIGRLAFIDQFVHQITCSWTHAQA